MEKPDKPEAKARSASRGKPPASKGGKPATPETTVTLTNPNKELWPDEHVTKKDLLDHYALVWPRMEQFVVNRPLALVRAPDGIQGQRFFQKHSMPGMSAAIHRSHDPEDNEEVLYIRE